LPSTGSLARALEIGRGRLAISLDADRRVAIACFGAACAVGLAFAFVGLDVHSFWYDELFTARLLEAAPQTTLLSRIATDVHPPIYLVVLSVFTQVAGDGDASLRAFSAISGCGAVVLFIVATRSSFSLPGRLFGAAMATGSLFWFFQSQNARSYALTLLIGTAVMATALALLRGQARRHRLLLPALIVLMFAVSFVHFYAMYMCLAVLIVLGLFDRENRVALAVAGMMLLLTSMLYVKLVIEPLSQVSLTSNWYPNDPAWYLAVLKSCLQYAFGEQGQFAFLLCIVVAVCTRLFGRRTGFSFDRVTAFLVAVPVVVVAGGIASSILLAPNFFDRNLLVVSPFVWALSARLYDAAVERASLVVRLAHTSALALIVLSMATIALARLPSGHALPMYEPFRQSAAWIRSLPACRDQTLPVITIDSPDWYKPGYAEFIYEGAYGRYLRGFAQPRLVFSQDLARDQLSPELMVDLQRRLDGTGCPVLAWSAHNMSPATIARIEERLATALDRRSTNRIATMAFEDGSPGYVLYVRR
jgi:hypothetical protein